MDYSSMKATKVKKKTTDIDFSISKKNKKRAKSAIKKSKIAWIPVIFVLLMAFAGGFFAHKLAFKNDTYAMIGEDTIFIGVEEQQQKYTELGVTCIAFNKDYSKDCTVKYYHRTSLEESEVEVEKVDETKPGIYYAVYTCPANKYKKVTLIRNIIVREVQP